MQRLSISIGASFIALCLALSFVNVCADDEYSAQRAAAVDTVLAKVANVTNTIFDSGLPQNANFSQLYRALIAAYSETETDDGLVWFTKAQMEITEQYFKACFGLEEQRPSVDDIGSHIQQFASILGTSPLDLSALRKQFGILICLHQQVAGAEPNCATVDCSGGLGNATTTGDFFCCLQSSDVRDLFGIELVAMTLDAVPCLAFVVDTTGSMSAEIAAVRALVNAFVDPADPVCYILVEFNDIGGVAANSVFLRAVFDPTGILPSGTLPDFTNAVNALSANGGGDCPEFGMAGLLLALDQISALPALAASLSQIILVTDASSLEDFRSADVITQALALGVPIHELLIRNGCGVNFGSFPAIANATGGIQVNNLADFDVITNFVQATLVAGGFRGDGMFGLALSSHTVTVSKFASVLQVLIRTNQPQVNITSPDGTTEFVTVSGTLVFFEDQDPLSGNWIFSVASGTLEIAVNAPILLDFFVSHVVEDPDDSTGILPACEPTACSIGRVAVSSTRLSDIDLTQPIYLAIVNTNTTNVIDEVQVLSCDGVLVSDDSLAFPPQEFRYRLRGTDCNGNSFSFTSQTKVVIDLQRPTTTVLNDHIGLSLRVGETRTLSTRLHHSAVGNTLFFSASASDGLTLENPTDEVTVPAGGNFTVMVTVTVSTSLAPGSTVFLYVLVEDPCSNITVTFHWSIHIRDSGSMGGDPHFSIVLPDNEMLCYTVQGQPGSVFNLISNERFHMNALFVPNSGQRNATWIGSLGFVIGNGLQLSNSTKLIFDATSKSISIGDGVTLDAKDLRKLQLVNGELLTSMSNSKKHHGSPRVSVVLEDVGLQFTVRFTQKHLEMFWQSMGSLSKDSHGLIGQFFRSGIQIDHLQEILILPGKMAVAVRQRPVWGFLKHELPDVTDGKKCWATMNRGEQGEGLIDGTYMDYRVDSILSADFKFKPK